MDLFYYGSQDIPPPLGGSGGRREETSGSAGKRVCEACSEPVTAADLDEGRASEIYGVVLCHRCGGGDDARPENRVELYFCDGCHVSVPVCRVDTGEALSGDGRILCLDCRAREHRNRLPKSLAVVLVFLLLAAGGFLFAHAVFGPPSEFPDHSPMLETLDRRLEDLSGLLADGSTLTEIEDVLDGVESLEAAADERVRRLEEARLSLDRLQAEFDRWMRDFDGDESGLHRTLDGLLFEAAPDR